MKEYPLTFYFRLTFLHLRMNGFRWTSLFLVRHIVSGSLRIIESSLSHLETKFDLPGSNSVGENALKWNHYRWRRGEDEWTTSAQWKDSVIEHIMLRHIPADHDVLEIGPGFGRWTRKLVEISRHLIAVDVAEKCITYCKEAFGDTDNVEFYVNDGRSLDVVSDKSIDYVWSFDVFVHVEPSDLESYMEEFRRILRGDGLVIIHHGIVGRTSSEWRSSLTLQTFSDLLEQFDFSLLEQFNAWGDNNEFTVGSGDVISVFRRS